MSVPLSVRWRKNTISPIGLLCELTLVTRGFPGGPVVSNPPFSTGDAGLIPGQGPKIPHVAGQLSP